MGAIRCGSRVMGEAERVGGHQEDVMNENEYGWRDTKEGREKN